MKRVALVGAGKIAQVAVAAINNLSGIEIVGGYDRAGKPAWWSGDWHTSLRSLLASHPDAVIILTPASAHLTVVREIWSINPRQYILLEKPMAPTLAEACKILTEAETKKFSVFYHAAYAPEVDWIVRLLPSLTRDHGAIEHYICFFSDPYDNLASRAINKSVYVDSWIDSGINCLSILKRLHLVDAITDLSWDHHQFSTARAHTLFDGSRSGTILTQWTVTAPSKSSTLFFADGSIAVIDHQATAGRVITRSGDIQNLFGLTSDVPRLVRHYMKLFDTEIIGGKSIFTRADHMDLHTMLLSLYDRSAR